MRRMTRWKMVFSTCLAAMALAGAARGEDKKPAAKPLDRRALDEAIYARLREVIDHGANLYNQGDWNGCYRLYEGALMSVRSQVGDRPIRSWAKAVDGDALKILQSRLGDHPPLKDVIETGIANARQTPELSRRAFVLRVVLDQVRAETKPAGAAKPSGAAEKTEEKKPEDKKDGKKPAGTASISGRVMFKGVSLTAGIITFVGNNGLAFPAPLAADGSYLLVRVKPGEYKVAIDTKVANPKAKIIPIPAKYSDPDKSGLTFLVKDGKQTYDINLN